MSLGEWAFTPSADLAVGTWTFKIRCIDGAGNVGAYSTTKTLYIWDTPTFDSPGHNVYTTDATPLLGGTNTSAADISGLTVTVKIDSLAAVNATLSGGTWSYQAPSLAEGSHTLVIKQIKGSNTISITKTLLIDSVVPGALTLTSAANTSSSRPAIVISGLQTSPTQLVPEIQMKKGAGSYVTMSISASGAFTAGSGTTSYQPSVAGFLDDDTYLFKARQVDAAGNASAYSTPISVRVKTSVVPPVINAFTITAGVAPTVTGTAEAGATVQLRSNGSPLPDIIADGSGNWTYTFDSVDPNDTYTLVGRQVDLGGAVSAYSLGKLTLTTARYANQTRPIVRVYGLQTSPVLAPVIEMDDGGGFVAMSISASGALTPGISGSGTSAYRPSVAGALGNGTYIFRAKQTSGSLNSVYSATVAVTIKTSIGKPTISPLTTQDNTPTITGTAEPGGTVTLRVNSSPLPVITVDDNGDWTYTFDTVQADGVYSLTANQTDRGGMVSGYCGAVSLKIDTQSPSAPIISSPVSNTVTSDTTPTFTGTAEVGSSVNLWVNGVAQSGTTAVGSTGAWTLTSTALSVSSSTYAVTVKATDTAGNVSPASIINNIRIAATGVDIALSATGATTPVSGGATTSLAALQLKAVLNVAGGGATVSDVPTTSFTLSDIVFSPAGSGKATLVKGAGALSHIWTINITPLATSGTMAVSVPGAAFQSPVNGINGDSNTYLFTLDRVKPTAVITSTDPRVNATSIRAKNADGSGSASATFAATVTFSEVVSGLTVADFTTVGSTVSSVASSTDGGRTYPIVVTRIGTATTLSVSLKADGVNDTATPANKNTASALFSRTYDATPPTAPVIASSLGAAAPLVPSKTPSYPCTVTFSEPVEGFTADDLTVTNAIISGFVGTGANYTFTLTPAEGQVSVLLASGKCTDLAGYAVPASNEFKRVLDSSAPEIA